MNHNRSFHLCVKCLSHNYSVISQKFDVESTEPKRKKNTVHFRTEARFGFDSNFVLVSKLVPLRKYNFDV